MFIFAIGYGVGPQFVSGFGKEGPRQVAFSLVILALCLIAPLVCAKLAGLDVGYAAGLYSGSQTISAAMGVASDQITRLDLPEDQTKTFLNQIPIGYAVTYIFGTIGSAITPRPARPQTDRRRSGPGLQGASSPPIASSNCMHTRSLRATR